MKEPAKAYDWAKEYLVVAFFCTLFSVVFSSMLLAVGVCLSEFANWILSISHLTARVHPGYTMTATLPFFVILILQIYEKNELSKLRTAEKSVISVMVSLGLILFAFFLGYLVRFRLGYIYFLGITFFVFCYSELVAGRRVSEASP